MRLQTLYLLLACVVMLGGCSRCEKDSPEPKHGRLAIMTGNDLGGIPEDTIGLHALNLPSYREVNYHYHSSNLGDFIDFYPSDTTWPEYQWSFAGSDSKYTSRYINLYYRDSLLNDTVYLTCRDRARHDSAQAKLTYHIRPLSAWPYFGNYQGRLYYQGDHFPSFSLRFFFNRYPLDRNIEVIQCSGLIQTICNVDRDLYFNTAEESLIIQRGYCSSYGPERTLDGMLNTPEHPCYPGKTNSITGPGNLTVVKNWKDSIKLKSIIEYSRYGTPVGRIDSIVFTGKKQL